MTVERIDRIVRARRLNAAEERSLGRAIRAAEEEAIGVLRGISVADKVLQSRSVRQERTRAAAVERLEKAVVAVEAAVEGHPDLRDVARAARAAWDRSDALRWQLALSARRVVPHEARRIAGPLMGYEDLVVEGWIGLHRAAMRFDPELGIRFCTYARWWARAQMTRAVDTGGRAIRLSGGAVEKRRDLLRIVAEHEEAGVSFTLADLAQQTGLSEARVELLLSPPQVTSLESEVDDGPRSRVLSEILADEDAIGADEAVGDRELASRVRQLVEQLEDERLRVVLVRRFGLDGGEPWTLRQVGDALGLSRERVRQIEKQACALLRERLVDDAAPLAA